jgi:Ni/Fe-hydrogenase subunit HybB-like protein
MKHDPRVAPLGGPLFTPGFNALLTLAFVGGAVLLWRFSSGLGVTTGMNDGFPWGIWIAFDVVTGTAIACGGYAVALLIYVFNKGQFHPLLRPAMLTTALGYTIAGFSIVVDVGRWWNVWKVPVFAWKWNLGSALLEVALCVMAYMAVSWVEVGHTILARWESDPGKSALAGLARTLNPIIRKALPIIISFGILLPTLHQSTLGTIFVISTKLHPFWHSRFLPVLFLVSCLAMGYSAIVIESVISHRAFRLKTDWKMLGNLAGIVPFIGFVWVALRLVDVFAFVHRPLFGAADAGYGLLFCLELALIAIPSVLLLSAKNRASPGTLFLSALLTILGGALYRFDVYLIAFNPGPNWHYFPSIPEMLITIGLVSAEIAVYIFVVKRFPILRAHELAPRS